MAKSGYVGFHDPTSSANGDLYFVARSLAPVAVAYDPVRKVIIIALHAPYTGVYHEFALDAVGCLMGRPYYWVPKKLWWCQLMSQGSLSGVLASES